jgi:hypothetical protein
MCTTDVQTVRGRRDALAAPPAFEGARPDAPGLAVAVCTRPTAAGDGPPPHPASTAMPPAAAAVSAARKTVDGTTKR